jgi:hypothetical protein
VGFIRDRQQSTAILVWTLTAIAISMAVCVYSRATTPAHIHIRWISGVDERTRVALEKNFQLTNGEFLEGRTWSYRMTSVGSAIVDAILTDPHVEDTNGIDRASRRVADVPELREGLGSALLVGFGTSTVGWWAWARLRASMAR